MSHTPTAHAPTLDELAADPRRAADLSDELRRVLTLKAAAVIAACAASPQGRESASGSDANLTILTTPGTLHQCISRQGARNVV